MIRITKIILIVLAIVLFGCKNESSNKSINIEQDKNERVQLTDDVIVWHVKALHPDGKFIDVKAIDKNGKIYDVKSLQDANQTSIMDVKILDGNTVIPLKIIVSEEKLMPVKGILQDGSLLSVVAITSEGEKYEVKGVSQSGNIIHIKAIGPNNTFYNIEAISPKGWINDVKGVKMFKEPVEAVVNGVEVYAHVKSLTQTY